MRNFSVFSLVTRSLRKLGFVGDVLRISSQSKLLLSKPKRREFTNNTIFKKLNVKCEDCGISAHEATLSTHHANHDRTNISLKNLVILCINCHLKREGLHKKKRDDR